MATDVAPPEGFVLDEPPPPGFVLDGPPTPVQKFNAAAKPKSDNFLQKIVGATIEPAAAMASGALGGMVAPAFGVANNLASGKYGTQEGIRIGEDAARKAMNEIMYQPRTETGRNIVDKIGKFVNDSGLVAVAPLSGEVAALSRSAPAAVRAAADAGRAEAGYAGEAIRAGAGQVINPVAESMQGKARALMQSAIKPTIKQLKSGDADVAIRMLLDKGISPNTKGVEKLRTLIDDKNAQIAGAIGDSSATVNKQNVLRTMQGDVVPKFAQQVTPTTDLNAILAAADDFANHPAFLGGQTIPVQTAQQLKQGTYQVLRKKYGQLGSADVEAQKGLARGLKEEIANAVPEVAGLNAEESALLKTLSVAERRALMELNKNPLGLSALAGNKKALVAFMADRSAAFKALAARALNRVGEGIKVEPPKFAKVGPQPDNVIPGTSNVVPYDYSQAVVSPEEMQNWVYGRPNPNVTTSPPSFPNALPQPSAEGTLRGVAGRRAFDRNMAASLDQAAQQAATQQAVQTRQPTGRGLLFDLDPITGRLREASQGIKGATPDTFQNFGNALNSAAEKVAAGQRFAMSAAEKVAWEKTKVDLAQTTPGMNSLTDEAIARKILNRQGLLGPQQQPRGLLNP